MKNKPDKHNNKYRYTIEEMNEIARKAMERTGLTADDVREELRRYRDEERRKKNSQQNNDQE